MTQEPDDRATDLLEETIRSIDEATGNLSVFIIKSARESTTIAAGRPLSTKKKEDSNDSI
jgi:hypothetical protein